MTSPIQIIGDYEFTITHRGCLDVRDGNECVLQLTKQETSEFLRWILNHARKEIEHGPE